MNRILLSLAAVLLLFAPAAHAKTVVATDAQNGKAVTLVAGDTLVVHLAIKSVTSSEWHVVYGPEGMLRLNGQPRCLYPPTHTILVYSGGPATEEFRFSVSGSRQSYVKGAWLRFLLLDPFEPGVKDAKLWQLQYTIEAAR